MRERGREKEGEVEKRRVVCAKERDVEWLTVALPPSFPPPTSPPSRGLPLSLPTRGTEREGALVS